MTDQKSGEFDVVIVGGGMGGVAAASAALRRGCHVLISEETDWLGGQLTSQGVPPDEHPWMEQFGSTRSYRALREAIRGYYRRWYPLTHAARTAADLNPGQGRVSGLCHEPRAAAEVLAATLAPYLASGRLTVWRRTRPVAAAVDGDHIQAVSFECADGEVRAAAAPTILDATELGDLLPLAGVEHVTGFESQADTGEPSAPAQAQPANMQAISWVFAVEHRQGEDHTVDRPREYSFWRDYQPPFWPDKLLSMTAPEPSSLQPMERTFVPHGDSGSAGQAQRADRADKHLWQFRRILARDNFTPGFLESDVTVVNWPMTDYLPGPVIGVSEDEKQRHLDGSRQLGMSMLYWLQTEAPRPDGGTGWPGLRLRGDVMGTEDGFAKAAYIRESRRIRARRTVVEQDLSLEVRGEHGAVSYPDSVGVGMYRIDLHPSTGGDNYIDVASSPFQIPLGALLPQRVRNLIAAGKNIGVTHVTNGCYRLHPVEWNVGEAAGALAAHCARHGLEPGQVHDDPKLTRRFQTELAADGVELEWPKIRGY